MKKVVLVFIHGMGDHQSNYDKKLKDKLKQKLGAEWNNIHCEQILYSERMQNNEEELFRRLSSNGLDWNVFRKFMLYNISDAAALCNCIAEPNCPYINTQQKIKDALGNAYRALGDNHKNVIIVAHSLGGHVISNYIWDCQTNNGIWENTALKESDDQDRFLRLMNLDYLFTTGCNIPIFVASHDTDTITPITTHDADYSIQWHNYYDKNDVLGWPLSQINAKYKRAIEKDVEINVGSILTSWNPNCHNDYWSNDKFIDQLSMKINNLL